MTPMTTTRAVRAEALKLTTIRPPIALLAVATALTVAFAVLRASQAGGSGHMAIPPLDTAVGFRALLASADVAVLLAGVLGAMAAAGEHHHGTATATYLAEPGRRRVVAAKAAVCAVAGALTGLAAAVVSTGVAWAFLVADDLDRTVGAATVLRFGAGATLAGALLAVAGVGVGTLVRDQLDAVMGLLLWGLVVERLIGGLFDEIGPYLPYTAATTLGGTPPAGDAGPLPFVAAATVVAVTAGALVAAGAAVTARRDVT
jgi:hypothetical protein